MAEKKKYLIVYYTKTKQKINTVGILYADSVQKACKKARKALLHLNEKYKEEMLYEMSSPDGFGELGNEWADWLCNININDPLRLYSVGPFPA